jgi:hypothetical protein
VSFIKGIKQYRNPKLIRTNGGKIVRNKEQKGAYYFVLMVLVTVLCGFGVIACGGGGISDANFEDRIKSHIHGEPMERTDVTVSGLSGFTCSWEFQGNKHLGIFLEEKVGSGMSVINFVDCQAPGSDFENHKADFEKIIASLKK